MKNVDNSPKTSTFLIHGVEKHSNDDLYSRPRPTLAMLEQFIKSADEATIYLTSIDKIRTLIHECRLWNEKFEHMQQGEHYPFLSSYEQLYEQARHFHIDLEPLKQIEQTILQARSWLEKTQAVFRRQDSTLTLIEVWRWRSENRLCSHPFSLS